MSASEHETRDPFMLLSELARESGVTRTALELAIPLLECAHRAVHGADDALSHLLELGLGLLERCVDRHCGPAY